MKQSAICCAILSLIAVACFEEDQRVPPYPGQVSTITDSVQTHVSYFDFETNQVIRTVDIQSWQLGFECGETGWHIITNSGANWFIYNTGQGEIDANINMPGGVDHLFDMPSYFPDSTAVGDWTIQTGNGNIYTKDVYLLGYYHQEKFSKVRQVIFQAVNDTAYRFFYRENDTGISDTVTIVKNDTVNYVYFDFEQKQQVSPEPDKTTWDLAFGPYYDLATLFGMTIPYLVGGSFLNIWQTEAILDSVNLFDDIDIGMIYDYQFSSQRDIPGYQWKGVTVDISGGGSATYAVKAHYNYIFHTTEDNYFKLKFLSYTLDGRTGFPQFEYRPLE
jgi:hypothetical protein